MWTANHRWGCRRRRRCVRYGRRRVTDVRARCAGRGRRPTSSAVWARVGSRQRDTGLTRSPSASRVSTPSSGSPSGSSSAVMGAVRRSISIPIVHARRLRREPSARETAKRVGKGMAPAARAIVVGRIVYVAPVSTRKRTFTRRRANTSASTYTCPMRRRYHSLREGGIRWPVIRHQLQPLPSFSTVYCPSAGQLRGRV